MWNAIVDRVTPYIVKVETPSGHGTGFLCLYNETKDFCGIATAWHVGEPPAITSPTPPPENSQDGPPATAKAPLRAAGPRRPHKPN